MRLNKYIAQATGLSRRAADAAINEKRVRVNDAFGIPGQEVSPPDRVMLDGKPLSITNQTTTVMLHKPVGYVVSRDGQGSSTVYDLLPNEYHRLKPIGRLDKDSSGLLLLSNDGQLANQLTHPSSQKQKIYHVTLDKPLTNHDVIRVEQGIPLDDGLSRLQLKSLDRAGRKWQVTMTEGRNRQIRRTFTVAGYAVTTLHRIQFGEYVLGTLPAGKHKRITPQRPAPTQAAKHQ